MLYISATLMIALWNVANIKEHLAGIIKPIPLVIFLRGAYI